jgi:hypothetical protein
MKTFRRLSEENGEHITIILTLDEARELSNDAIAYDECEILGELCDELTELLNDEEDDFVQDDSDDRRDFSLGDDE